MNDADQELLIGDVLRDLRMRAPLPEKWATTFRSEAREYMAAIAPRTTRLDADLRTWAYSIWRGYEAAAAEQEAAAQAEEQRRAELAQAPYRERSEKLWTSKRRRPDAELLRQIVEQRRIGVVYHWTEAENLESILRHGLRSRAELTRLGIRVKTHSYGSALKEAQLASHIGLMLRPHEGMIREARDPIVLELEPGILGVMGAIFVPGNSARSDIDLRDHASMSTIDAFVALFEDEHSDRVRDWQAEVWIPDYATPQAIKAVAARSAATHRRLAASWDRLFGAWPYPVELVETAEWNVPTFMDLSDL